MADHQGHPDSFMCRWCKAVRVVHYKADEHTHRMCHTCDGIPTGATWEMP